MERRFATLILIAASVGLASPQVGPVKGGAPKTSENANPNTPATNGTAQAPNSGHASAKKADSKKKKETKATKKDP